MNFDRGEARKQLREDGFFVLPGALDAGRLARANAALEDAVATMRTAGIATHWATLDPNDANIRVNNLPEWNHVFMELLAHPAAIELAHEVLGPHAIVSNFTGNIALSGSRPMKIHADQALVIPPPWNEPWAMNVIWCLDDLSEANGATRYVPGSHRWTSFDDVPADVAERSVAFEASAGSLIAMEGRMWHTSGANTSADKRRAMLFAYYSSDFVRQQVNWEACLSPETKSALSDKDRKLLGLGPMGNARIGGDLVRLGREIGTPPIWGGQNSR